MKTLPLFVLAVMSGAALAQDAPPKKDPFTGFGNTALDRGPQNNRGVTKTVTPAPFVSSLPPRTSPSAGIPAMNSSLTFDAKTVSNGGGSSPATQGTGAVATPFRGQGGVYLPANRVQTRVSHPVIEVDVRNMSATPANAHFDWFFIATDLNGRSRRVWDKGERDVNVAGRGDQVERLESTGVAQQTINQTSAVQTLYNDGSSELSYESRQVRTGERPDGWIVRMWVGGALVKVKASTDYYEQIGHDPAQLDALLGRKAPPHAPGGPH